MDWSIKKISHHLLNLNIKPTYLINNLNEVLESEEYLVEGSFCKCPYCDGTKIIKYNFSKDSIEDFIEILNYTNEEKEYFVKHMKYKIKNKQLNNKLFLTCCSDCNVLLQYDDSLAIIKPNFTEDDMFKIMVEDEIITKSFDICKCPCCNNSKFKHTNSYQDEMGEVEYDIICDKCNYKISHFAYGSYFIV